MILLSSEAISDIERIRDFSTQRILALP